MVSRPYSCPHCHASFRNESGMYWHLAHRHEIPAAIDALGKEYEAKTTALKEENAQLKKKVEQLTWELEKDEVELVKEKEVKVQLINQISELNFRLQKALLKITARDLFIKEKFGIDVPEPNIT